MGTRSEGESLEVPPDHLRWTCDPTQLGFETTAEVEPLTGLIGQGEALDSLRFGLEFFAPGQNVFVRGLTGTGRMTLVRRVLEEIQPSCALASDCGYVANFENMGEPRLVQVARGRGAALRDALEELITFLHKDLGPALTSENLVARRQFLDAGLEEDVRRISRPFEEELAANELSMVQVKVGTGVRQMVLPLLEGEPAPPEKLQRMRADGRLSAEEFAALEEKVSTWMKKLEGMSLELRQLALRHAEEVRELFQSETRSLVEEEVDRIRTDFPTESVARFLDTLVDDVLRRGVEELAGGREAARRYRLNLIGGHHADEGCPVVVETTPTLANLLGSIDSRLLPEGCAGLRSPDDPGGVDPACGRRVSRGGGARDPARAGCLARPSAHAEQRSKLEIVPGRALGTLGNAQALKPEPIPVQVKVILIGDPGLYYALDASGDPDFPQLFKVLADFETRRWRCTPEAVHEYARRPGAHRLAQESLPAFHRSAVAASGGARRAHQPGGNDRLTTRLATPDRFGA